MDGIPDNVFYAVMLLTQYSIKVMFLTIQPLSARFDFKLAVCGLI